MRPRNKGMVFTTDALISISLLLVAASIILYQSPARMPQDYIFQQSSTIAQDNMKVLTSIPFSEVENSLAANIIANTNITEEDNDTSIIDIIGNLWAENSTQSMQYAQLLVQEYIGKLIPTGYKYGLYIEDEPIYEDTKDNYTILSSSMRLISGIREGTPSGGTSTRISINNILSKSTSKYTYFGGFEGEGNITKILTLPSAIGNVTEVYIELDTVYNFTIYVNGKYAGYYNATENMPMIPHNWTMNSSYYGNFTSGQNNITLNFSETSNGYIGGGFIKTTYNTSQMDTSMISMAGGNVTETYEFPGIVGFMNLYSSFYIPGTLNNMSLHLHIYNPYDTYLYIGNTKIYENHTNLTSYVDLDNAYLSSMLDYSSMDMNTIPIRLGIKNITGLSDGSDVVLITDLSGSMNYQMNSDNYGTPRTCTSEYLYYPTTQRISVAKCIDKEFIDTILKNDDQRVGAVGYNTTTVRMVDLTSNNVTLKNDIESYGAYLSTCISCGISSSTDILKKTVSSTTLIDTGHTWNYTDTFLLSEPPADPDGSEWYAYNYSSTTWSAGPSVFGYNGAIPEATTITAPTNVAEIDYLDLWDDDPSSLEVSFETGYNATANTYGWNNGDDGWDYDPQNNNGPFGYDDNVDYNITFIPSPNEYLEFDTQTGYYNRNTCSGSDCSGAYGIEIEIDQYQYDIIRTGNAKLSFRYEWSGNPGVFESNDHIWIKARWTEPDSSQVYLGENLDNNYDPTDDIAYTRGPSSSIPSAYATIKLKNYISGPGKYYLELGGKQLTNAYNEWGHWRFDDILIEIKNGTSNYYFRTNFTVDDYNKIGRGFLKIASEGNADIYLNGELIESDPEPSHESEYWNRMELIDRSYIREGNNVLAAKLYSHTETAAFNLRFESLNTSRNRAMLVMSDGEANVCYGTCPDGAKMQAIQFACEAYENYGIVSHAVGFSSEADNDTLRAIAECGHGVFKSSGDASELRMIYNDIANAIISYTTQKSDIIGQYTTTTLYPDSYIEYNYTPVADIDYGEISLTFSSDTFGETSGNPNVESPKNGTYWIPPEVEVVDAKATSYSSEYWTSILDMKSETSPWTTVFNLSSYNREFIYMGDPYIVYMPTEYIEKNSTNYASINSGTNLTEFAGGSPQSRVIYTLKLRSSASYSEISSRADGCTWKIEQYNNKNTSISIPTDYTGDKNCTFSATEITYDSDDSIDNAALNLFRQLDVTGDNKIDIAIDQTNIDIRIIKVRDIPWMWGPAIMRLDIWR